MLALLAETPALPLDEAGKYVAGAYVVFLVLLVVYVAIMAAKLQRIERELRELAGFAEQRNRRGRRGRRPRGRERRRWLMSGAARLGVSHKTAPLELRERLALTEGRAVGALRELTAAEGIHEAAAISTCNRTELYLVVSDPVEAESAALGVLARQAEIRPTELLGHLYSLRGGEAARHLFRVTAGLDSMIVGEAEIQGQVKRAYELALVEGATGPILNRLFRGALAAGERVRSETAIGEKGVSIPSVAVELARRTLGDLAERRVLVVGAGETAELVARALAARGVATVFVANRHYDRAIGLAQRFDGEAVRFEELPGAARGGRHRRHRDQLAPPHHRARRARPGDGGPRGAAAAADRPRRAARHRPGLPRDRRGQPPRPRRRPADRRAQRQRPRGRGAPRRADPRRRARPLRALARLARGGADDRRAARARRRGRAPRPGRERRPLGEPLRGRPRAAGGDGEGDRLAPAARADPADEALGRRRRGLPLRQRPARAVRPRRRTEPSRRASFGAPR